MIELWSEVWSFTIWLNTFFKRLHPVFMTLKTLRFDVHRTVTARYSFTHNCISYINLFCWVLKKEAIPLIVAKILLQIEMLLQLCSKTKFKPYAKQWTKTARGATSLIFAWRRFRWNNNYLREVININWKKN